MIEAGIMERIAETFTMEKKDDKACESPKVNSSFASYWFPIIYNLTL